MLLQLGGALTKQLMCTAEKPEPEGKKAGQGRKRKVAQPQSSISADEADAEGETAEQVCMCELGSLDVT